MAFGADDLLEIKYLSLVGHITKSAEAELNEILERENMASLADMIRKRPSTDTHAKEADTQVIYENVSMMETSSLGFMAKCEKHGIWAELEEAGQTGDVVRISIASKHGLHTNIFVRNGGQMIDEAMIVHVMSSYQVSVEETHRLLEDIMWYKKFHDTMPHHVTFASGAHNNR